MKKLMEKVKQYFISVFKPLDIRKLIFLVCVLTFILSTSLLIYRLIGYEIDYQKYREIQAEVIHNAPESHFEGITSVTTGSVTTQADGLDHVNVIPYEIMKGPVSALSEEGVLLEYEKYFNQNEHMIGFIHMPGFRKAISYPIMQAEDNIFYLNRDFSKNNSYAGSIYADYLNNLEQLDRHVILYGHAMKDNSMLGNLKNYPKDTEAQKNKKIYIDLKNTRLEYEVFSSYITEATYPYRDIFFNNDQEYLSFLQRISEKSAIENNIEWTPNDKIITLSTCYDNIKDGRTVVHARLVRQIIYTENDAQIDNFHKENVKIITANVYMNSFQVYGHKLIKTEEAVETEETVENEQTEKTIEPEETEVQPVGTNLPEEYEIFEIKLNPSFRTTEKEYAVNVPLYVDYLSFKIELSDKTSLIEYKIDNIKLDPQKIVLPKDKETVQIDIKITSQDKLYARTYTLLVNQEIEMIEAEEVLEAEAKEQEEEEEKEQMTDQSETEIQSEETE